MTGVAALPEPHIRLVFAVLLFRDGILSGGEFHAEATRAFGDEVGGEIARIVTAVLDLTAAPSE